ncbi:hypothetical protein PLICRDRAFT_178165 [Plicaturopsis crispa FD-325 SS-3]|nr:hypothetical protein PLICRDRAFT_178165 [Plicaturopsis crispa FD-325 SS-3]
MASHSLQLESPAQASPISYFTTLISHTSSQNIPAPTSAATATPNSAASQRAVMVVLALILSGFAVCVLITIFLVLMRRHALKDGMKRRRQASWILRSSRWPRAEARSGEDNLNMSGSSFTVSDMSVAFLLTPLLTPFHV